MEGVALLRTAEQHLHTVQLCIDQLTVLEAYAALRTLALRLQELSFRAGGTSDAPAMDCGVLTENEWEPRKSIPSLALSFSPPAPPPRSSGRAEGGVAVQANWRLATLDARCRTVTSSCARCRHPKRTPPMGEKDLVIREISSFSAFVEMTSFGENPLTSFTRNDIFNI
jgi:hypothetical protein